MLLYSYDCIIIISPLEVWKSYVLKAFSDIKDEPFGYKMETKITLEVFLAEITLNERITLHCK